MKVCYPIKMANRDSCLSRWYAVMSMRGYENNMDNRDSYLSRCLCRDEYARV